LNGVVPLALQHHDPATLARRRLLSRTWAGVVVAWSVIRTLIVWAAVGDYGLNPWIYLAIDLASACIDAITTPRMVLSFIDDHHRRAIKWAVVSLVAFVVPDAYIFWGTRTLPAKLIVVIVGIIGATLSVGVIGVVRKIRSGRVARAAALQPGSDKHRSA
jgi:hypothetical protein